MKQRLTILALTTLTLISVVLTFSKPVNAGGATQIEGVGFFAETECMDPEGNGSDFALLMTGDLEGCLYVFAAEWACSPSGTYRETGTEIFVGNYNNVGFGSFETAYLFTAKLGDCSDLATEIWGRCQHPIVRGSGMDDFEGVTGRFDIKDDIDAGTFPYKGHLRW